MKAKQESQHEELLLCPFRGSEASITEQASPAGNGRIVWTPGCDGEDCSAAMYGGHATKRQAIADWNKRVLQRRKHENTT